MAATWESHFSKGTTAARPAANTLPQGAIYWSTDDHKFFVGSGPGNTWSDFTAVLALVSDLATYAPLASPTFTGTPAVPTAAPGTNSTQAASTAFVAAALAALIGTAPGVLDTLGEISDALNDDANLYTTLATLISGKIAASIVDVKGDLITATAADTVARLAVGTDGQRLKADSGQSTGLAWTSEVAAIPFVIDGGGAVITTGVKGDLEIPFAGTITGWSMLGDQSGSITIDTWKDTYANFPPDVADTMWGTKPNLSAAAKNQATGLSIAVAAGDVVRFNVDSAATVTRVTLSFTITKS